MLSLSSRWRALQESNPDFGTYASMLILTAVLIIFMSFISEQFLTAQNFYNIFVQLPYYLVLAVGLTIVLATGGIDISIGSLTGLSASIMGYMMIHYGFPVWMSILAGILVGVLGGLFNGLFITKFKVAPIIVCLGTFTMFRALAYEFTGGHVVFGLPTQVQAFTRVTFLGFPGSLWLALLTVAWGLYFMNKTKTGREILALGGNEKAASLAGINVSKLKYITYGIMGLMCAFSGLITMARLNVADPQSGTGYEFHVLAAVVLGGTSVWGGRALMLGSFIAVVFLQIANNALYFSGISWFWQRVMIGSIFIIVVAIRTFRAKEDY